MHVLAKGHILMEFRTCPGSRIVAGWDQLVCFRECAPIYIVKVVME